MIAAAYFVFGLSGFGSGLVAIPVLTHLWPVQFVLPVMVVLDLAASSSVGVRERRHAKWRELLYLTPFTFVGLIMGVTLLVTLPQNITLASLGAAVMLFGFLSLRSRGPRRPVSAGWVVPTGLVSGVASGLFGVGGAPAVIYLSGRISDKSVLRATLATMLFISVVIRAVLLVAAGLLAGRELLTAAALAPFGLIGLLAGSRIHLKLSREQFARFVAGLVIMAGLSLIARSLLG
ncbi:MAG: hypothetical protein A3I01_02990 [Betaproteobacteria bacterium RIFCSPLOWO2_02_FULL_65_24]|nr:MAG: hypothetical protein A3I01_02990 [Betaproteobacteria bacterium RIFCSPLOWO2_02_FULL_65_24]